MNPLVNEINKRIAEDVTQAIEVIKDGGVTTIHGLKVRHGHEGSMNWFITFDRRDIRLASLDLNTLANENRFDRSNLVGRISTYVLQNLRQQYGTPEAVWNALNYTFTA